MLYTLGRGKQFRTKEKGGLRYELKRDGCEKLFGQTFRELVFFRVILGKLNLFLLFWLHLSIDNYRVHFTILK